MFQLLHGDNAHGDAMRTSPEQFLDELERRVNELAAEHAGDEDYLLKVSPLGPEWKDCQEALDSYVPDTKSDDPTKVKKALTKLFFTSKTLGITVKSVRHTACIWVRLGLIYLSHLFRWVI